MRETQLEIFNPMTIALDAAVPLRIMEIRQGGRDAWLVELLAKRKQWIAEICEKGDVLQFGGKKGEAAALFNNLALGLAHLAFVDGGVRFAGRHWVATFPGEKRWRKRPPLVE